MPSASLLYSLPVPLGRRGTVAAVVVGLHVLLAIALVAGLAHRSPTTPDLPPLVGRMLPPPQTLPPVQRPPSVDRVQPGDVTAPPPPIPQFFERADTGESAVAVPPVERRTIVPPSTSSAVATAPRLLSSTEPLYPAAARRLNQEGSVLLRVRVDALGRAEAIEVARSSGHSLLDAAAMDAVRRWRFAPAQSEGRAISGWVSFTVTFRLTER